MVGACSRLDWPLLKRGNREPGIIFQKEIACGKHTKTRIQESRGARAAAAPPAATHPQQSTRPPPPTLFAQPRSAAHHPAHVYTPLYVGCACWGGGSAVRRGESRGRRGKEEERRERRERGRGGRVCASRTPLFSIYLSGNAKHLPGNKSILPR